MDPNYCDITFILDRSGSMATIRGDAIGGFNEFVRRHREAPGRCTLTLNTFNHKHQTIHRAVPIGHVAELTEGTYVPDGWTSLLDAVCRGIDDTGRRLDVMLGHDKPGKVLCVILTDGIENHSKEFTLADVQRRIERQRREYNWEFVFLGANIDAISVARSWAIPDSNAIRFAHSPLGTSQAFVSVTANSVNYRTGTTGTASFVASDYQAQTDAGVDPAQNAPKP